MAADRALAADGALAADRALAADGALAAGSVVEPGWETATGDQEPPAADQMAADPPASPTAIRWPPATATASTPSWEIVPPARPAMFSGRAAWPDGASAR